METSSASWLPIGLTVFLLLTTWLANCILLGGALQTASSGRIAPVAYFFVGSQAIAALLYVTLNLPPAAVGLLFGSTRVQSRIHVFCLYSTYLDTLFCNLTFLQTFFSSLDAYLRLRNPTFYLTSAKRRPALWLKVGSPWLVAGLQAIGQLALSDRDQVSLHFTTSGNHRANAWDSSSLQTTCLLPDPNFLIIRTAIAYALPLIVCIILVGLQLRCLRNLRTYPYDSLQALLQVRTGIHSLASGRRTTSSSSPLMRNNQNPRAFCSTSSSSKVLQLRGATNLCDARSESMHPSVYRSRYETQLLTNSIHLDRQCTFETLLPDGTLSTHHLSRFDHPHQLLAPSSHVSHIILPTSTIPFFELRSIDTSGLGTDVIYATNQGSIINCPTHGPVSMTVTEQPDGQSTVTQEPVTAMSLSTTGEYTYSEDATKSNSPRTVEVTPSNSQTGQVKATDCSTEQDKTAPQSIDLLQSHTDKQLVKSSSAYSMPPSCNPHNAGFDGLSTIEPEQTMQHPNSSPEAEHQMDEYLEATTPLWLRAYHGEQLAVAINLVSCIIAVGTWSPFILSTLAHGLCQPLKMPMYGQSGLNRPVYTMHPALLNLPQNNQPPGRCMIQVTPDRIADFRWWAYASAGLLLPCLLFFLDLGLREGCWRALRYTERIEDRSSNKVAVSDTGNPLRATNRKQTYRCTDSKPLQDIPSAELRTTPRQKSVEAIRLEELWNKRMEPNTSKSETVQNKPDTSSNA